jgi:hypothetical protein
MCFVAMVFVAMMMRSFVVMLLLLNIEWWINTQRWKTNCEYRRYSAGCRSPSGCSRGAHVPDIVFLDVHIVHTSVKFSKVVIVTLNKVVGVLLQQTRKRIRLTLIWSDEHKHTMGIANTELP